MNLIVLIDGFTFRLGALLVLCRLLCHPWENYSSNLGCVARCLVDSFRSPTDGGVLGFSKEEL